MQSCEKRQHFRIDDAIYFDYLVIKQEAFYSEEVLTEQLLKESGKKYLEIARYFFDINHELDELGKKIGIREPALIHYLNLINNKIDYLSRQLFMTHKIPLRKVNMSLGGMAFKTTVQLEEKASLKVVIYTKPHMIPLILDAVVAYSQYQSEDHYRTSIIFNQLSKEQEYLLSQHILLAQTQQNAD